MEKGVQQMIPLRGGFPTAGREERVFDVGTTGKP